MIEFLQKYLQIDTCYPNALYDQAIGLFQLQAERDGFDTKRITLPSGFPVFVITFRGSDESLPSVVLNHHMDVVPAQAETWSSPPFSGEIVKDKIIGRGAQDMKGVGVIHYFALQKLKKEGFAPTRTIHLLAVPDEERGGLGGVGQLVETEEFKQLNVGFVLDEGIASGDKELFFVKVSERKPIHARFTAHGELGHGSRLDCKNVIHDMSQFLSKLVSFQKDQVARLDEEPAGLLMSANITSFQAGMAKDGGIAFNIVPDKAVATVDFRVPPQMRMQQAHDYIEELLRGFPTITKEIVAQANDREFQKDYKTEFYTTICSTLEAEGYEMLPLFAEFGSDLRFYLEKGIEGFGLTPFIIEGNIHGIDEAIYLKDLDRGRNVIASILKNFCS